MDQTTITDTRPRFARLTEGRATRSWRKAVPAVIIISAVIALLGYLASAMSSAEQRAMSAERDSQQTKEQTVGYTKQITSLQRDNALARSPGRTTVILESADKKAKQGAAWAAVTWGELPDGKTFMRVNAYGLEPKLDGGKAYQLWMQPLTGDPVHVGALEADQNGSGFAMNSELPAVDQGKTVMLTADAESAKQPGDPIAQADLPKLKPAVTAPPASDEPQAKAGSTSQQMHQEQAKPAAKPAEQQPGK